MSENKTEAIPDPVKMTRENAFAYLLQHCTPHQCFYLVRAFAGPYVAAELYLRYSGIQDPGIAPEPVYPLGPMALPQYAPMPSVAPAPSTRDPFVAENLPKDSTTRMGKS